MDLCAGAHVGPAVEKLAAFFMRVISDFGAEHPEEIA
jgi:hypothetical protein